MGVLLVVMGRGQVGWWNWAKKIIGAKDRNNPCGYKKRREARGVGTIGVSIKLSGGPETQVKKRVQP